MQPMTWEQKRSLAGFIDIARTALQSARAMIPDVFHPGEIAEANEVADKLYEIQCALAAVEHTFEKL